MSYVLPDSGPGHVAGRQEVELLSVVFEDLDDDGLPNQGDVVTVEFGQCISIRGAPLADDVFDLDPKGSLGSGASLSRGAGPREIIIALGDGATVQPNGVYQQDPESSGLGVSPIQFSLTTCSGFPARPMGPSTDVEGEIHPHVVSVLLSDLDGNCGPDQDDTLEVAFTRNVSLSSPDPSQAFRFLVPGDSLGSGSRFVGGRAPTDVRSVVIILGRSPTLTALGVFDPSNPVVAGPSGLDVVTTSGRVFDAAYPQLDARPQVPPGVDVAFGPQAHWVARGNGQVDAEFGAAIASAGDVNGDGFADVIVGAPLFDSGQGNEGKAYLYLGGPGGLSGSPFWSSTGEDQGDARFGADLTSAGDVDGDGYSDILVGAPGAGPLGDGKVYLYLGGPNGPSPTADWESAAATLFEEAFGAALASAGDVNGDGFSDFLVGAPRSEMGRGLACLYLGGALPLSSGRGWTWNGRLGSLDGIGASLASAGDVNGDGYSDVIVGAPGASPANPARGAAYVFLGESGGLSGSPIWESSGDDAPGAGFGHSVSGAGDVDGDGFDDILVGAPWAANPRPGEGKVFLHRGGALGPSLSATVVFSGDGGEGAAFGVAVASAGDVDSDGLADVIVGSHGLYQGTLRAGHAYVFLGSPPGVPMTLGWTSAGGGQLARLFGAAVGSAGDVNGDGRSEVIVGAPRQSMPFLNYETGQAYLFCLGR